MRILVVVYACEPDRGSEPGVGWNVANQLAKSHDVVALTRANNRCAIEAVNSEGSAGEGSLEFLYCDSPTWLRAYKRGRRGIHLYQLQWQVQAFAIALREHRRRAFDLVWHVTFTTAWLPSLFSVFPAPFVWGPLSCNEPVPSELAATLLSRRDRVVNLVRRLVNSKPVQRNPILEGARRRARTLLVVNEFVAGLMPQPLSGRIVKLPVVAAPSIEARSTGRFPDRRLRVLCIGQLIGLKGFVLAVEAVALAAREIDVELTIIGDGEQRARLENLSKSR
ncbi:MAG: hypothetical protein KC561_07685, partial [Myxococcales bacterium]|nr:hypothetical protein [Myxococcales bacterium]